MLVSEEYNGGMCEDDDRHQDTLALPRTRWRDASESAAAAAFRGLLRRRPPTAEQFDSRRARRSDGRAVPRAHRFVCEGGVSWNSSEGVS